MNEYIKQLKTAFIVLLFLTVLTGIIYPLIITGIAQLCFPWKANGSIIKVNDQSVGSLLIGQSFSDPKYFWGRPSATTPFPYNSENSAGSNLAMSNPDYKTTINARILKFQEGDNKLEIPDDLLFASASGLDPNISAQAAYFQVKRIAAARHIPENDIRTLIQVDEKNNTAFLFNNPFVNVLQLNIRLDALEKAHDN
jgi:K+-transporting ATPase ATPase C chain